MGKYKLSCELWKQNLVAWLLRRLQKTSKNFLLLLQQLLVHCFCVCFYLVWHAMNMLTNFVICYAIVFLYSYGPESDPNKIKKKNYIITK